jgi:hypothetical protein
MAGLKVTIARFVDEHQPGFVECTFADASGVTHSIIEKVPVISAEDLWMILSTHVPVKLSARCSKGSLTLVETISGKSTPRIRITSNPRGVKRNS